MRETILSLLTFLILATGECCVVVMLWIAEEEPIAHTSRWVTPVGAWQPQLDAATRCTVRFTIETTFDDDARSDSPDAAVVTVKLPPTIAGVQSFESTLETDSRVVIFRNGDERFAQAQVRRAEPPLTIALRGELSPARTFSRARAQLEHGMDLRVFGATRLPADRWYAQERWHGQKIALVERLARETTAIEPNAVAAWAFEQCRTHLHYQANGEWIDFADAIARGKGDCTEFADFFIALCRARGVAARACMGWSGDIGGTLGGHQWAEVYDPELGWVVVDPTWADSPKTSYAFGPRHLLLTGYDRGYWQMRDKGLVGWFVIDGDASGRVRVEITEDRSAAAQ